MVAVVDDEQYRLAVRQAETAVGVAQAALDRAKVQQGYAQSELQRARNLVRSGGITETRKMIALARAFHVAYCPHIGFSGAVCAAALLAASGAAPRFGGKHQWLEAVVLRSAGRQLR